MRCPGEVFQVSVYRNGHGFTYRPATLTPRVLERVGYCMGGREQPFEIRCCRRSLAHGYQNFLQAIRDESDPEHEQYLEWVGGSFDPEAFSPSQVLFDDPKKRLRYAFLENNGGVTEDELILPTRARRLAAGGLA